ncbi:MAG: hypothetical protein M1833_002548 [Piccolia ochrophora]|nr:MAG: hypothetical protein M1833_002548 [Piccolia ochrophora]
MEIKFKRHNRLTRLLSGRDTPRAQRSVFFSIPPEIRLMIYCLLLTVSSPLALHRWCDGSFNSASRRLFPKSSTYNLTTTQAHTSILRTCKLIYLEGRAVLYSRNCFLLDSPDRWQLWSYLGTCLTSALWFQHAATTRPAFDLITYLHVTSLSLHYMRHHRIGENLSRVVHPLFKQAPRALRTLSLILLRGPTSMWMACLLAEDLRRLKAKRCHNLKEIKAQAPLLFARFPAIAPIITGALEDGAIERESAYGGRPEDWEEVSL